MPVFHPRPSIAVKRSVDIPHNSDLRKSLNRETDRQQAVAARLLWTFMSAVGLHYIHIYIEETRVI